MKFTLETSVIKSILNEAVNFIGDGKIVPAFSYFYFDFSADTIKLYACNQDMDWYRKEIPTYCLIEKKLAMTIPAKKLVDTVNLIKEKEFVLETIVESKDVMYFLIESDSFKHKIRAFDDNSFFDVSKLDVPVDNIGDCESNVFHSLLSNMSSVLDSKSYSIGNKSIFLRFGNNNIESCSTDNRNVIYKNKTYSSVFEQDFLIPVSSANLLLKLSMEYSFHIGRTILDNKDKANYLILENSDTKIAIRLYSEDYVDFRCIIEQEYERQYVVNTKSFKEAFKKIQIGKDSSIFFLNLTNDSIKLNYLFADTGDEIKSECPLVNTLDYDTEVLLKLRIDSIDAILTLLDSEEFTLCVNASSETRLLKLFSYDTNKDINTNCYIGTLRI